MTQWRTDRVGSALAGTNPTVMARLDASFAVIGDVQFLPGYSVAITDRPGVDRLTDLPREERLRFLADMERLGEAVERACAAADPAFRRVNLEILGNTDAFLHAHVWPRYDWEPPELVGKPVWLHPAERWQDPSTALGPAHDALRSRIASLLTPPVPSTWEQRVAALQADDGIGDEDRIARMRALAAEAPHPALAAFELGGALDSAGREAEADVEYAAATAAGLGSVDAARAAQLVVQHASTLRNLGRVDEAIAMLRDAPQHEATGSAPAVFLALALHSAGMSAEALRTVVEAVEPSLPRYHRSVRAYAADLTEQP